MDIELRNIKYYPELTIATSCFTGKLFVNNVWVADVSNRGTGSASSFSVMPKQQQLYQQAASYCEQLPPYCVDGTELSIPMDLGLYVENLLGDYLVKEDRAKAMKKIDKLTETNIVVVVAKELEDYNSGKLASLAFAKYGYKRKLIDYSPSQMRAAIDKIRQTLKPGEKIYNDLSFLDLIYEQLFPTKLADAGSWDAVRQNLLRNFDVLKAIDQKVKPSGQLLYRYFYLPVADGRAYYQIIGVNKSSCQVGICDGISADNYMDRLLGEAASMPLAKAKELITARDGLEQLLSKK